MQRGTSAGNAGAAIKKAVEPPPITFEAVPFSVAGSNPNPNPKEVSVVVRRGRCHGTSRRV